MNQKLCIPSWPGVFQFDTFLSVILSISVYISAFGPSSNCSSSLVIWFIHSAFSLCCFFCHILVQNRSVFLHSAVGMFYWHLLPIVDRIFCHYFGMSYFFCIVLLFVDMFLTFLILQVLSGIFPHVVS